MKILFWTHTFWPSIGGVEMLSLQLIADLRRRGFEFEVVTSHAGLGRPDEEICEGIPVHRFDFIPALARRDLKEIMAIKQRLSMLKKKIDPDLTHIHYCDPAPFFHLTTHSARPGPTVVTVHYFSDSSPSDNSLQARIISSADRVTAVSKAILDDILRQVPEVRDRSSVIYSAITTGRATEPSPLPFERPMILCLGRLVQDKGFDLAISAFDEVVSRHPEARLVISGDGPLREELEKQTARLGLSDFVDFTGWISPVPDPGKILDLINTTTLVILPSRYEPFGMVALQAAQGGRPAIATRTGGLQEIIDDGRTGFLFEKEDVRAIAEKTLFLLDNPEKARQMGRAARRRAEEKFSWESCVDAYEEIYIQAAEAFERRADH